MDSRDQDRNNAARKRRRDQVGDLENLGDNPEEQREE